MKKSELEKKLNKTIDGVNTEIEALVELHKQNEKRIDRLEDLFNKNNQIGFDLHQEHKKRLSELESSMKTVAKHVQEIENKETQCSCNIEVVGFVAVNQDKPKPDYFLKAKNLLIEYAEKTMIKKGLEYTPIGDRFANFRPILGENKTALEKLIGYNAKHVQYCYMQETNMTAKNQNELLEHWGDVFNYNILGLAMLNTDKEKHYTVPYADRATQEKEIKDIVINVKELTFGFKLNADGIDGLYFTLLNTIRRKNLDYIIYLFAKQLERLENSK